MKSPYRILIDGGNYNGCGWKAAADTHADILSSFITAVKYCEKYNPDATVSICFVRCLKRHDYDVIKAVDLSI